MSFYKPLIPRGAIQQENNNTVKCPNDIQGVSCHFDEVKLASTFANALESRKI